LLSVASIRLPRASAAATIRCAMPISHRPMAHAMIAPITLRPKSAPCVVMKVQIASVFILLFSS
jgi:hypothetical protein